MKKWSRLSLNSILTVTKEPPFVLTSACISINVALYKSQHTSHVQCAKRMINNNIPIIGIMWCRPNTNFHCSSFRNETEKSLLENISYTLYSLVTTIHLFLLYWTQDKGLLPDGQLSDNNDMLIFNSVRRNSTGVYICKASNGVGSPASQSISVVVQC